MNNYEKLAADNLARFYQSDLDQAHIRLAADRRGNEFWFRAFGADCRLRPTGIYLNETAQTGVLGILISLYALHAGPDAPLWEPFKAFKDFRGSSPYVAAFAAHAEQPLIPQVNNIRETQAEIIRRFDGQTAPQHFGGDFSFIVNPLPKIALCYVFYLEDEDFPASATCLFSANAQTFMPLDGLADVGEYTSALLIQKQ